MWEGVSLCCWGLGEDECPCLRMSPVFFDHIPKVVDCLVKVIRVYWFFEVAVVRAPKCLQFGRLVHVVWGSEVLDVFQSNFPCRVSVVDSVQ